MKAQLESYAARLTAHLQDVGAHIDPEVLQLPGGSVIATLLWLCSKSIRVLRSH